jgi:hypothetical protein
MSAGPLEDEEVGAPVPAGGVGGEKIPYSERNRRRRRGQNTVQSDWRELSCS